MSDDEETVPKTVIAVPLDQIMITPNALASLSHQDIISALGRHKRGDWGDVDGFDKNANDAALREGSRLLSAYHSADGVKFWIITEADRSLTTVLLPRDY